MKTTSRRRVLCVLGALAAATIGLGLAVRRAPSGPEMPIDFSGRGGILMDYARAHNGALQFRGWLVIGAPETTDETYGINVLIQDSQENDVATEDLGIVQVAAGASHLTFEFHGEQPLRPGTYALVVRAFEPGQVVHMPDGSVVPSIVASTGRTVTVH